MLKIATIAGARSSDVRPMLFADWPTAAQWLEAHARGPVRQCAKADLPAWVPAEFLRPERVDEAVHAITALVLDIDRAEPAHFTATTAELKRAGIAFCWHGSPSYPLGAPRGYWPVRLILPLARPVPAAQWRGIRRAAIAALGYREGKAKDPDCVDATTCNESRLYFLPGPWQPDAATLTKHGYAHHPGDLSAPFEWRDGSLFDALALTPIDVSEPATGPELPGREVIEGERHDKIFRAACSARARGHDVNALVRGMNARCKPPLDEAEIDALIRDVIARYPAGHGLTDLGNAELFAEQHGGVLRYVHGLGWIAWDGQRWREDTAFRVDVLAGATVRSMYAEAASMTDEEAAKRVSSWARACESSARIAAMSTLARSRLAIAPETLDADPFLFVAANASIDVRTGAARPHAPRDLCTKSSPVLYDPSATCPTWRAAVAKWFPDPAVREYLKRWIGYCLTGDVREQTFVFLTGDGANGKSVLVKTIAALLGSYGVIAPPKFLVERRNESHPTEILRVRGARAVFASELTEGDRWNEERIKSLTGGEMLSGRAMHQDFVDFQSTAKIVVSANHRPTVRGTDHAIWRRMRVVPCDVRITEAERDPLLAERLRAELPGVLLWALEGCRDWLAGGMREPGAVLAAVEEYRDAEDALVLFLEAETVPAPACESGRLYERYLDHCRRTNVRVPLTQNAFGRALSRRGHAQQRGTDGQRVRVGIGLKDRGWN